MTHSMLVAAAMTLAIAPAAGASTTGSCIPSGATALHRGAAETVSVYRYPGGPITACHGQKPAVQLGGWRDAPWPKHADAGPTTALRAVSGQCVATTQTEDGEYARQEIQIADVQSQRRFTTAARYESERYYGSYVRLREVRLTSDCAAVLIYTAWDGHAEIRLPDPVQVIDASGSRTLPDGTDPAAALAGLEGRPVNTDLATPPPESRAKPVSGRPVLRATRNGAATLTLRLPPGTRGLTLHLAGRPVVVDQVKVRDKSLEWSTKPSAEPHTVELRVPGRADASVRARARYRITTTLCTIGCRTQSWTARARETAQPAS